MESHRLTICLSILPEDWRICMLHTLQIDGVVCKLILTCRILRRNPLPSLTGIDNLPKSTMYL